MCGLSSTPIACPRATRARPSCFRSWRPSRASLGSCLPSRRPGPGNLKVVSDLLSPAAPHVADGLLVASSLGLVLLGRGLARRRHRSWQAALWLLADLVHRPPAQGARRDRLGRQRACRSRCCGGSARTSTPPATRTGRRARSRPAFWALAGLYAYGLAATYVHAEVRGMPFAFGDTLGNISLGLVGIDPSPAARPLRARDDDQPGHGRRSSAPSTSCGSRCGRATAP